MIEALRLLIPLWSANVLVNIYYFFQKKYNFPDYPLDDNKMWFDGRPVLGSAKKIFGFPMTLLGGYFGGILANSRYGLLSGLAVFLGSVTSGFIKRRLGIKQGDPLWIIDQSDYLLTAYLLFLFFGKVISTHIFLFALAITIPVHFITNIIAYFIKLRKTYW